MNRAMTTSNVAAAVMIAAACQTAAGQCQTSWATHLPAPRTDADMAFDAARGRLVMFGGVNGATYRGDTWEYDGAAWRQVSTAGPAGRRGHKMVYDSVRRRTLMFGGFASPALGAFQTWAWDGATWRLVDDATGPTMSFSSGAALDAAAAFDPGRGRAVLYLSNGETWEWDNLTWTRRATAGPGTRRGMAMAYDRTTLRVILYGGASGASIRNDTWAWDGERWTQLAIAGPGARSDTRMAYDSVAQRVLLYGGVTTGSVRLRDTWVFDGSGWTAIAAPGPGGAAGGSGSCMAFDAVRQQLVLLGGTNVSWADIAMFDGAAWTGVDVGPSARAGAASAYDAQRRRLVLFGGLGTARTGDTWEWDGGTWRQVSSTGPAARSEAAMAYDPTRGRVVMFGGMTSAGVQGDTWEWDGANWTRNTIAGPSPRERHAMCFDPITQRVMLEGGSTGANETWLYDGAAWVRVANGPTRSSHAITYHPGTNRVILYGGSGGGVGQTAFGWDGQAWAAIGGPGPSSALEHSLTLDEVTGQLVLLGPTASDAASWFFDGTAWTRVVTPLPGTLGPRARSNHAAWFDRSRQQVFMFGGTVSASPSRETWEFQGRAGPALASTPAWVVSCEQGSARFAVDVAGGGADVTGVTWFKNGSVISSGVTESGSVVTEQSDGAGRWTLTIENLGDRDIGAYDCALSNACGGVTVTSPAQLTLCAADFNCSGSGAGDGVSEQDLFDFLSAYFAGDMRADMSKNGSVSIEDVFEFLRLFFTGC